MPAPSIRFDPKHQRLAAALLITLACLAIAWTLARYLTAWFDADAVHANPGRPGTSDAARDAEARALSDYPLFGALPEEPGGSDPVDAPESTLALILRGTLAAPDPRQSLAIIADGEGNERTYRVGMELPGGATLERVHEERALIRFQGRLQTLPLRPAGGDATDVGGRRLSARRPASTGARDAGSELERLQRAMLADPTSLAGQITLQPVHEDGEIVGMRLQPGMGTALMGQFGIRATDVITEVNGMPLNRDVPAEEVLRHLQGAQKLQVTLLRNGQRENVTVPLGK